MRGVVELLPNSLIIRYNKSFVLPVSDTTKTSLKVNDGKYIVDDDGLVYVPASMMKGVDRYKIYQNGQDIEKTMQYTGLAEDHIKGGDRRYVVFYLAPTKSTSFTSSQDQPLQGAVIENQRIEKMKSLLVSGKIHFRYPFFQR